MPRRQRQEWIYTCGHCGTEFDEAERVCLNTHGDWGVTISVSGPEWHLLLEGEEWFCSIPCFMTWLRNKIDEVMS